jgi:glycosyltransferase involved in cell wall biosynthesis
MHNPANLCCSDTGAGAIRLQSRFRRIARRADALLAVSPGLLEAACERFFSGPRPHALAIPNPAYRRDAAEAAMAAPRGRPVAGEAHLVFAGRLSAQKDPATLIRAAALLEHRHRRPFQLSVLGEGPMRDELHALARELGIGERVHFRGFVPDPMAYMADADVLAVPSVEEAFGYVLVEALAVGLPIVSTDCPYGPRYILDNGRYGHLVPVGDAEAMADAIARTLDEPADRDRLIARARDFDSIEIARRYGELFKRLIAGRRARR